MKSLFRNRKPWKSTKFQLKVTYAFSMCFSSCFFIMSAPIASSAFMATIEEFLLVGDLRSFLLVTGSLVSALVGLFSVTVDSVLPLFWFASTNGFMWGSSTSMKTSCLVVKAPDIAAMDKVSWSPGYWGKKWFYNIII